MTFQRVTTDQSYRTVDQLDGKDLIQGEALRVRWPDGSVTEERVLLDRSESREQESCSTYLHETSIAYVSATVRGASAKVLLTSGGIECERVEP
jgi:hypothetical protein